MEVCEKQQQAENCNNIEGVVEAAVADDKKESECSNKNGEDGGGTREWKSFIFKPAEPENYQDILNHMRTSFYRDEPLNHLTGYSEGKAKDMDSMIMEYFGDGLSHIVLEKGTNEIAGARIIAIHKKEDYTEVPRKMESAEMNKIWPFLHQLDEASNIFKFYPEVDSYADLFMASVDRRFRGQGLATEMYESAVPFLKSRGISIVKSCFTSPFTRRIGKNLGFRELTRRHFRDYFDDNGDIIFANAGENDEAVVGALQLL